VNQGHNIFVVQEASGMTLETLRRYYQVNDESLLAMVGK